MLFRFLLLAFFIPPNLFAAGGQPGNLFFGPNAGFVKPTATGDASRMTFGLDSGYKFTDVFGAGAFFSTSGVSLTALETTLESSLLTFGATGDLYLAGGLQGFRTGIRTGFSSRTVGKGEKDSTTSSSSDETTSSEIEVTEEESESGIGFGAQIGYDFDIGSSFTLGSEINGTLVLAQESFLILNFLINVRFWL